MARAKAIDRTDLLDKAARLVTRGDLKGAVSLYEQLFQYDSKDWSIGNTLGDLYTRVGQADAAIAHFMSLAEQLGADGFAAKQRALYRKILRIQPDNAVAQEKIDELERQESGHISPFLKRVLETARASRETPGTEDAATEQPAQSPRPVAAERAIPAAPAAPPRLQDVIPVAQQPIAPPAAAPIASSGVPDTPPPPSPAMPASSHEWADEWAAVLSPGSGRRAVAPAPSEPTPIAQPPTAPAMEASDYDLTDFHAVIAAADADAARRNWAGAASTIEQFLASQPQHIDALEKLIDVGVEGGLDERLISAQSRLASACFEAGRVEQARNIAVDLTEREPGVPAHRELLARVAVQNGGAPPEAVDEPHDAWADGVAQPAPVPIEMDPPSAADQAFEEIRTAMIEDAAAAAEERLAEAERLLGSQKIDAAVLSLEEAVCAPHLRASAGSRLAAVYRDRGEPEEALLCLEWVAQEPPATEEGGHELAYQLALTLEALGQHDQALGVYRELLAEVGTGYRDVATRAERLAAA